MNTNKDANQEIIVRLFERVTNETKRESTPGDKSPRGGSRSKSVESNIAKEGRSSNL